MGFVIHKYLSPDDIDVLRATAAEGCGWTYGRQATGYEVLSLKKKGLEMLIYDALKMLGETSEGTWDAYLLRYPDKTFIPKHKDEAPFREMRHRRINSLVTLPRSGGELIVDDWKPPLELGDAFIFYPDEEEHEVTPVVGERLVFSVGAWVKRRSDHGT